MGWDVELLDEYPDGDVLQTKEKHTEGSTYIIGGTNDCWLAITFNYSEHYNHRLKQELNGKKAGDTLTWLDKKIEELGTKEDTNYWAKTKGNAGYALTILRKFALEHPDGWWRVS